VRACSSFASCRETTRATTGCGGCESVVRRLLGEDVAVPVG
jgi:NAD(P)H-nitrite reductase large subunit